jgi:hypothetical protein
MENQNQPQNTTDSKLADLESVLGPMSLGAAQLDGEFLSSLIDIDLDESEGPQGSKKVH